MLSVNRFVAVYLPNRYVEFYKKRSLWVQIVLCWAAGLACAIAYAIPNCGAYFDPLAYVWTYPAGECGFIMNFVVDFVPSVMMFGTCVLLDVATFVRLQLRHGQFGLLPQAERERRKREISFLAQSFVVSFNYVVMQVLFHAVAPMFPGKHDGYWMTTVVWLSYHATNGIIYMALAPAVRSALSSACKCRQNAVAPSGILMVSTNANKI